MVLGVISAGAMVYGYMVAMLDDGGFWVVVVRLRDYEEEGIWLLVVVSLNVLWANSLICLHKYDRNFGYVETNARVYELL